MYQVESYPKFPLESESTEPARPPLCQNSAERRTRRSCARDEAPSAARDRPRVPHESARNAPAFSLFAKVGSHSCFGPGQSRVQPGLKLSPPVAEQFRQLGRFQLGHREQLAIIELIEIKKRQRGPLRFRRSGNPDGKLLRIELFDLGRRRLGQFVLLKIDSFGLQTLLACLETTPARVAKKPEPIARRLATGRQLRSFAQSRVKHFLRFRRISQH